MTKSNRNLARKLLLIVASLALFATACGGGGGGQTSEASSAAEAAAAANEAQLRLTGDVASSELLNTTDGEIAQLTDVVTGDRPVLLWYWAPH